MNIDVFKQDHVTIMGYMAELKRLVQTGVAENPEAIARLIVSISSTVKLHLPISFMHWLAISPPDFRLNMTCAVNSGHQTFRQLPTLSSEL
jgi:hypothetical protein